MQEKNKNFVLGAREIRATHDQSPEVREKIREREKELGELSKEEVEKMTTKDNQTWKRTPWIEEKILGWLADGKTKKRAAELSGITEKTLYNWINSDEIFKERVTNAMGGAITLRAIDNVAEAVTTGDVEASKWWIAKTKTFEKRYDPKYAEHNFEPNPKTGVYEVVEPESIAGALLGPEVAEGMDEEDLDELLYAQDPDIKTELPGASGQTEAGTESETSDSLAVSDEPEV